jgi:hypothetical protein
VLAPSLGNAIVEEMDVERITLALQQQRPTDEGELRSERVLFRCGWHQKALEGNENPGYATFHGRGYLLTDATPCIGSPHYILLLMDNICEGFNHFIP